MNDKFMFKLAQIRSSYTRKRFGTLNNEEKALCDYEKFCLELIKDYEKLEQENKELQNKINKSIEYIEDDDNFWIPDSYSEDKVKMIQKELKQILKDSDIDE